MCARPRCPRWTGRCSHPESPTLWGRGSRHSPRRLRPGHSPCPQGAGEEHSGDRLCGGGGGGAHLGGRDLIRDLACMTSLEGFVSKHCHPALVSTYTVTFTYTLERRPTFNEFC